MRPGIGENSSDHPGGISRRNRRSLAPSERHLDAASVAHGLSGQLEKAFQEHRRSDGDDPQAGPCERLLTEPVLPLLTTRGGVQKRQHWLSEQALAWSLSQCCRC